MSSQVLSLREVLEARFPGAVPLGYRTAGAVSTGVAALDRVLPGGGLPRGRLTQWGPGGGATAVLRAACTAVLGRGERAAWVEGGAWFGSDAVELAGPARIDRDWKRGWRYVEGRGGVWPLLIRAEGGQALACAEELLVSGGFGLVVLSGVEVGEAPGVRLSRAVRSGGGAFVLLARHAPVAGLRIASRIAPDGYRWHRDPFGEPAEVESVCVCVELTALGVGGRAEFRVPVVSYEVRLSLEPGRVDRRGAVG